MSTDLIATRYLSKQLLRAVIDETATANLQRLPPPTYSPYLSAMQIYNLCIRTISLFHSNLALLPGSLPTPNSARCANGQL